jgi:anti-sigma regulatory factor (Ser/Thr protein kinase)
MERPGGRGIFIAHRFMTWVKYNVAGNCVTLCKVHAVANSQGAINGRTRPAFSILL